MTECEWIEGVLACYVGGETTSADTARADRHLARCPACARAVGEYREVIRLARSLPPPVPPPEVADRILGVLRVAAARPPGGAADDTRPETALPPDPPAPDRAAGPTRGRPPTAG